MKDALAKKYFRKIIDTTKNVFNNNSCDDGFKDNTNVLNFEEFIEHILNKNKRVFIVYETPHDFMSQYYNYYTYIFNRENENDYELYKINAKTFEYYNKIYKDVFGNSPSTMNYTKHFEKFDDPYDISLYYFDEIKRKNVFLNNSRPLIPFYILYMHDIKLRRNVNKFINLYKINIIKDV